ncbi:immunity 53 family protein, partial [Hymenobacter rubripertinctus]
MDLLQRIQRWYTINCNGDWEHSFGLSIWHGISVQTLDNPGWIVTINLVGTCLIERQIPYSLQERTTTDWFGFKVEEGRYEGVGGPENLTEILQHFLETYLPNNIDPDCRIEVNLPITGYENKLWLKAKARMVSESTVQIVSTEDSRQVQSYQWSCYDAEVLLDNLNASDSLSTLKTQHKAGDLVDPSFFEQVKRIKKRVFRSLGHGLEHV